MYTSGVFRKNALNSNMLYLLKLYFFRSKKLLFLLLLLPLIANAATFTVPALSTSTTFTVSWTGLTDYGKIERLISGTWSFVKNVGPANGSTTVTAPGNGTFQYRLVDCDIAGGVPPVHNCTPGSSKTIIITAAPVISGVDNVANYTENAAAVTIDSNVTISDADTANLNQATISIAGNFISSEDALVYSTINGITGSYNSSTGVLTLSGTTTVANYDQALESVKYQNSSNSPNTATRTISFVVRDSNGANSAADTTTLTVTAVNDAPTVSDVANVANYTENNSAVTIDSSVTIADPDSAQLNQATVSITNNFSSSQDQLVYSTVNGIAGSYNSSAGVLTLSHAGTTLANFEQALETVKYQNTSDNPSTATRTISFVARDTSNDSGPADTTTLTITAVNDAPVISGVDNVANFIENTSGPVTIDSSVSIADVDSTQLNQATVSITGNFSSSQDQLVYSTVNGITGSYNSGTGVLTLSHSGTTLANFEQALESVQYNNSASSPNTATRTISIVVRDTSNASSTADTTTVLVSAYVPYAVPNTPANLTGPEGSLDGSFLVDWDASTTGVLAYYELEETINGSSSIINTSTTSQYSDTNANGAYSYRVRACSPDADGPLSPEQACSAWSSPVSFNAFTTPDEFAYDLNDASFLPDMGDGDFVAITKGKADVNSGASQYSVPIELPPAVNNLKPGLALMYNSRGGNGLVGLGWSLAGLSAIARCSPIYASGGSEAQDSNPRYSNEDRLCLDAKRLQIASDSVPSTASNTTYWAENAEYRTEIDTFAKIKASGVHNGAHQYFTVWTKSGLILSYGRQEDSQNSRIFAPGQGETSSDPISIWALDKVEDRYGNEYTIHYQRNNSDGDYYPTHIVFEPDASIVFTYENRDADISGYRSDMPWGYDSGYMHKHPKLLDKITTYIDVSSPSSPTTGTKVREYEINYTRSVTTDRYLVSDILECGFDGSTRVCAEPLEFEWQAGELGFEPNSTTLSNCSSGTFGLSNTIVADIDNDGYMDTVWTEGTHTSTTIRWGTSSGCFQVTSSWTVTGGGTWDSINAIPTPKGMALIVGDNDEDTMGVVEVNRATSTLSYQELDDEVTFGSSNIQVGDVNNDGLADFMIGNNLWKQNNTNPITFTYVDDPFTPPGVNATESLFADFTSDGSVDFLGLDEAHKNLGTNYFDYVDDLEYSDTDGVQIYISVYGSGTYQTLPGSMYRNALDVNADGKLDLAWHISGEDEGPWYVRLNTGDGFGSQIDTGIETDRQNQYTYTYDWDKDGRQDLLACCVTTPSYSGWNILLSTYDNGGFAFKALNTPDPFNGDLDYLVNQEIAVHYANIIKGDINNDGQPDIYWQLDGATYLGKRQQPDLLKTVTDGFGAEVEFDYSPLVGDSNNGQPLYTPSSVKPVFPQRHVNRSLQVVKRLSVSDGEGGQRYRYFNYTGGKEHAQGRGFLGFEKIVVTDTSQNTVTTANYKQDFPFIGLVDDVEIKDSTGKLISITDNKYSEEPQSQNDRFYYLEYSIQQQYGLTTTLSSSPLSVAKVENTFDQYGNLTDRVTKVGTGLSGTTVTGLQRVVTLDNATITNNTTDWLLGFVEDSTVYASVDGTNGMRTFNTEFDSQSGTLDVAVRRDFVGTSVWKTTTTTRNSNGVITEVEVEAGDIGAGTMAARTTTLSNFADLIYPGTRTNALTHETILGYDERFGAVDSETDPNGLTTTREYDLLGRLEAETDPDGTVSTVLQYDCSGAPVSCPADAVYLVATEITNASASGKLGAPLKIVYYDELQREVRNEIYSLNDVVIKVDTEYYGDGRVHRVSEPFTGSSATDWTAYESYDTLNRPIEISKPDGGSVEYEYAQASGLLETVATANVLTPNGSRTKATTRYTDALGQVVQVLDADSTPVDYEYDSQGNLVSTEVNNNTATVITIIHDMAGNKTSITDPDAGNIDFEYNGFGELRRQTWDGAVDKSMTFTYDVLGRKTGRTDDPNTGGSGGEISYTWAWDTVKEGLLTSQSGNGITETYAYDSLSRLQALTTAISGLSGNRVFSYTYDAFSQPKTVEYPDGLKIEHQYHAAGMQAQTRDVTNISDPKLLWTIGEESDARGNLYQQRFGNGAITLSTFEPVSGRIAAIQSGWPTANGLTGLVGNIQDLFYEFDTLGNLYERTTAQTDFGGDPVEYTTEQFEYDDLNRLESSYTNWLGIGTRNRTYQYDALGNLTNRSDLGALSYAQSGNAGAHAVTSANGQSYTYDEYGNLTGRGAEDLVYDVSNKPIDIDGIEFHYGPQEERFKQVDGGRIVYYINGGLHEEIVEGGTTTKRSYVGDYLVHSRVGSEIEITYLHRDHIGSVEAMTDKWANLLDRMSFEPWGKRQLPDWNNGNPPGTDPDYYPTTRGYTGHEHLDQINLIHMNGRVYDPVIGRFLSPDLFVQAPYNSQSFNRYSYVFNNPLSYTDPSGYNCAANPTNGSTPNCDEIEEIIVTGQEIDYSLSAEEAMLRSHQMYLNSLYFQAQNRSFFGWLFNEANMQIADSGGIGAVAWSVFAEDVINSVNNTLQGDVTGVATSAGMAAAKPLKIVKEALKISEKVGVKPKNMSPEGAGRKGALNEAKRQSGVPTSQQPSRVLENVDETTGKVRPGRIYEYEVPAEGGGTKIIRVRDDVNGHDYGPGNSQNRGPHFNDEAGNHYDY